MPGSAAVLLAVPVLTHMLLTDMRISKQYSLPLRLPWMQNASMHIRMDRPGAHLLSSRR